MTNNTQTNTFTRRRPADAGDAMILSRQIRASERIAALLREAEAERLAAPARVRRPMLAGPRLAVGGALVAVGRAIAGRQGLGLDDPRGSAVAGQAR